MAICKVSKSDFREHLRTMLDDESTSPLFADVILFIIEEQNPIKAAHWICQFGACNLEGVSFYFQARSFFHTHEDEIRALMQNAKNEVELRSCFHPLQTTASQAWWAIEYVLDELLSNAKLLK